MLPAADAAALGRVEQDKDALVVAKLARRFVAIVRGCNAGNQADSVGAGVEQLSLASAFSADRAFESPQFDGAAHL